MTEDRLERLGVAKLAEQFDLVEAIATMQSSIANKRISKPSWVYAIFSLFVSNHFLGARLNSGKRPEQQQELFIQANSNIAVVSALMLTTSMPLALEAQANNGYGLTGHPLYLFYFFTFLSGAFLMLSLIMSIFMSLLAGQLSNDTEIIEFFESLSDGIVDAKVAPLRLMCLGVWSQFFFWTVWMVFNDSCGAVLGTNLGGIYGSVGITIPWLTCFWWVYVLCVGLKALFKSKMASVNMHLPVESSARESSRVFASIKGSVARTASGARAKLGRSTPSNGLVKAPAGFAIEAFDESMHDTDIQSNEGSSSWIGTGSTKVLPFRGGVDEANAASRDTGHKSVLENSPGSSHWRQPNPPPTMSRENMVSEIQNTK